MTGQAHSCSFPRPSELFSHQNPKSLDKREDPSQCHGGHGVRLNRRGQATQKRRPSQASRVAPLVKNLLTMQKTWVWSPGREDPLADGMAAHSSVLAWRIPWTEEPGGLQSTGSQRVGCD